MYDSPEITQNYTTDYGNDSWQQPIWIAFLASLGIHAILGINLPNIPLFSKPAKLPPTVGLVELTPEQIARLPQPKTEPDISFSNIQPPSNLSQIPQQQPSFPRLPSPPTRTPSVDNLPRTSLPRPSYEIPERPPTRSTVRLEGLGRDFPSSVSRLPRNQTPVDNDFTYVPPPTTPVLPPPLPRYPRQLPNINRPSLPSLPEFPEENLEPTEAEIRRSLNLNDDVYESGLFAQNPRGNSGNSNSTPTEFKGSLLEGLRRPQERYQDKIAAAPTNSRTNSTATRLQTPRTAAEPEQSEVNRLPESPLARQIREGKTLQQVLEEETNPPERVAVVTPENTSPGGSRQPEVERRETPPAAAKVEEQPAATVEEQEEFKDLFLAELERSRQQRRQTTSTPEPKAEEAIAPEPITTPEPEPIAPTPTVAVTMPKVETPPRQEVVENPPVAETAPEVEPTPEPQPKEEFKGSLLASLERDRQPEPETVTTPPEENSTPPQETVAAARTEESVNIEVPTAEFEEPTPAAPPTTEGQGEFKGTLLAKLEQYRRQQEQMDAAGNGVFSAAEMSAAEGGEAYYEWAIALGLEEKNLTNPTKIADVYPDAACSENLTGRALVGVLVNADGEIIEGPKLLLGSGNNVLDEAALSAASDRSFDASDKSKAYQFAFTFNNSTCGGE